MPLLRTSDADDSDWEATAGKTTFIRRVSESTEHDVPCDQAVFGRIVQHKCTTMYHSKGCGL